MTDGLPDELPPEFLAAFADGELGPRDQLRVEAWLIEHPEGRELLDEQESLGPRNLDFWQAVRPPEPSRREWEAAASGVRHAARVPSIRRWIPWAGSIAVIATATAATVLFSLPAGTDAMPSVLPESTAVAPPTVPDEQPYAMATSDEVRIVSLPEAAAHLLVVGEHPLGGSLIVLARADEVEFLGIGTDLAGRFPEFPTEAAADDSPMIWAPKER
jgi:anti-sigma factor RsiW